MVKNMVLTLMLVVSMASSVAFAGDCKDLPNDSQLRTAMLATAAASSGIVSGTGVGPGPGGLFGGARSWGAVVNRDCEICAYFTTTADPTQVWPGSQAIAKAKAYAANAFSLDVLPISTARLYTFTQPGHSLWSLGQSNLWNPQFTAPTGGQGGGKEQIAGGLIFF